MAKIDRAIENSKLKINTPALAEKTHSDTRKCAKCGACTSACPVYQVTGRESHTPRGRLHLLSKLVNPSSSAYGEIFSTCLLCGACLEACPRKINTIALLIEARKKIPRKYQPHFFEKLLIQKSLSSPRILSGLTDIYKHLAKYLPESSGLWHKLSLLPENFSITQKQNFDRGEAAPAASFMLFKGCLATHLHKDITSATSFLTQEITGKSLQGPKGQTCCGLAAYASGRLEEAKKLARKNITSFSDTSLPILTSCASCYSHLHSYPHLLSDDPEWSRKAEDFCARLVEFSQFFDQQTISPVKKNIFADNPSPRIFYHDPCHLRFGKEKIIDSPRNLIKKATGLSVLELPHGPHCCGQGGLFNVAHPDISNDIFTAALTDFKELNIDIVVTTCSGCLLQWQKALYGKKTRVLHLAVFLTEWITRK